MAISYKKVNGQLVRTVSRRKAMTPQEKVAEEIEEVKKTFTEGQMKAFEDMINPDIPFLFLSGEAGCGKTYVVKQAVRWLRNVENKWVAVCATTATAARLLDDGAVTVHKFFKLKPEILISERGKDDKNGKPVAHATKAITKCDVILIDEVSMMRVDLFLSVLACLKKSNKKRAKYSLPPIRLILVGDMCQLPPVLTDRDREDLSERLGYDVGEGFAFQCPEWEECNFNSIILKEVMRQKDDADMMRCLNRVRMGDGDYTNWFNENCSLGSCEDAVSLFPYNWQVRKENKERLAKLSGELRTYKAELRGNATEKDVEDNGYDAELHLKQHCLVMIKVNPYANCEWCSMLCEGIDSADYIDYFCNGSMGIYRDTYKDGKGEYLLIELQDTDKDGTHQFVKIYKKFFDIYDYVEINGKLKKVKSGDGFFAYPIVLGYALSIHKSQGCSLSKMNLFPTKAFASGMLYVGLSRCRTAKGIYLQDMIRPWDAMLSPAVKEFYKRIEGEKERI